MFNSERAFGKHFVSGKPAPYWHKHGLDWVPTLQLAKKNYRAKLGHDANAKKRYELARGRTRAVIEAAENVESLTTCFRQADQAPNKGFFDTNVVVRFYTGLPSMEILIVVFEHVS